MRGPSPTVHGPQRFLGLRKMVPLCLVALASLLAVDVACRGSSRNPTLAAENYQELNVDVNNAKIERMENGPRCVMKRASSIDNSVTISREDGMVLREGDAFRPFPNWFSQEEGSEQRAVGNVAIPCAVGTNRGRIPEPGTVYAL